MEGPTPCSSYLGLYPKKLQKSRALPSNSLWVQTPAAPLTCSVTLGRWPHLSVPVFCVYMGRIKTEPPLWSCVRTESRVVTQPALCPAHRSPSIRICRDDDYITVLPTCTIIVARAGRNSSLGRLLPLNVGRDSCHKRSRLLKSTRALATPSITSTADEGFPGTWGLRKLVFENSCLHQAAF